MRSLREPLQEWNSITKQDRFLRECEKKARRALRAQRQSYILKECLAETARRKLSDAATVAKTVNANAAWVPISDRLDKLLEKYEGPDVANVSQQSTNVPDIEQLKILHSDIYHGDSDMQLVPLLDSMVVAGFVQQTLKNNSSFHVNEDLTEKHYIFTGVDDDPLFSSLYSPPSQSKHATTAPSDTGFLDMIDDSLFNDKDNLSQLQLEELAAIQSSTLHAKQDTMSLVDSIAFTAKSNLHKMTHEVHKSLIDVRGSQINLSNYREFIDKKKKQRIQCQRDLREHCCTCKGPHIAKPPFSHGKDYRREPTHEHCQNDKCTFIKKKKRELTWLDETIGKYDVNQNRFEKEILKREDETERRKENLKEALANSLRLMEIAS